EFSGRRKSIPGGFGLDILSRTPAELHPARRQLTLCCARHEIRWLLSLRPAKSRWLEERGKQ
ncbi:MAG: hypothetical protein OXE54_06210, partial [Gammaproteobacteria bacterium]|nr:hypothetical protein [Gammaproteobacteria bacterium]